MDSGSGDVFLINVTILEFHELASVGATDCPQRNRKRNQNKPVTRLHTASVMSPMCLEHVAVPFDSKNINVNTIFGAKLPL